MSDFRRISTNVDSELGKIRRICLDISMSSWVKNYTYSNLNEKVNAMDFIDISNMLSADIHLNPILEYISVVYPEKNSVLSPEGRDSMEFFFANINKFDVNDTEAIFSEMNKLNYFKTLKNMNVRIYNKKVSVIPIIQSINYSINTKAAVLFSLVNKEAVLGFVDKQLPSENDIQFFIIDSDGSVIIKGAGNNPQMIDDLLSLPVSDEKESLYKKGKNFIFIFNSDFVGWKYVFTIPEGHLSDNLKYLSIWNIILVMTVFISGLFLSIILTIKKHKPIFQLFQSVSKSQVFARTDEKINEIQYVQKTIDFMKKQRDINDKKLIEYEPVIHRARLIQMIKVNFITVEEYRNIIVETGLGSDMEYSYGVIVMNVEKYSLKDYVDNMDQSGNDIKTAIVSFFSSYAWKTDIKAQAFVGDNGRIISIICLKNERLSASDELKKIALNMKNEIKNNFECDLQFGYGDVLSNTTAISKSYQKAEKMLDWILFTGDDSDLSMDDFTEADRCFYFYPTDWEVQIMNHLKNGDIRAVNQIITEIKYENCVNRILSSDVLKRLFLEIIETGMKVIDELDLYELMIEADYRKVIVGYSESEIWQHIEKIYNKICSLVKNNDSNMRRDFFEQIFEYVNTHYDSNSISLKELAGKFNITEPALSKLFKQNTRSNFHDYISRKRISKAKNLLQNTQKEIYIISNMVGYENDDTFRRVFKKIEGVSPAVYREKI